MYLHANIIEPFLDQLNKRERNGEFYGYRECHRDTYIFKYAFRVGCGDRVISYRIECQRFAARNFDSIFRDVYQNAKA